MKKKEKLSKISNSFLTSFSHFVLEIFKYNLFYNWFILIEFIAVGVLGGLVRALYGLLKAINDGIVVDKGYFLITLVISGIIGGLLGTLFTTDFRIACLAGYVGTDVLENIFTGVMPSSIVLTRKFRK